MNTNPLLQREREALDRAGVKPVPFRQPAADQGCSGNRVHAALCRVCDRLLMPGVQMPAAAYFGADGESQCRNLMAGGKHDQSVCAEPVGDQHLRVGGVYVQHHSFGGVPE